MESNGNGWKNLGDHEIMPILGEGMETWIRCFCREQNNKNALEQTENPGR